MNNKALENFLEKIDKEDFKETKGFKPKDSIADKAKSMKLELEEGLKEIDEL